MKKELSWGTKDDTGKSPVSLIPPDIWLELADLFGVGAKKYAPHNWAKGMEWHRVQDALHRHLLKWESGETQDEDDGQRHLISCIWCALVLAYYEKHKIGTDDRFFKAK
jgi:hypothetical protein